jgi:hypothetical protein
VILPVERKYQKEFPESAHDYVREFLKSHGSTPRHRANRLLFVAADASSVPRLKDAVCGALAWKSIVEDVEASKLNLDQVHRKQAEREWKTAEEQLPRMARECFRWVLCPAQHDPKNSNVDVEAFAIATSGGTAVQELERVCAENELVIVRWSPIHLRSRLKEIYWKPERTAVAATTFWEDTLRYLYLPRLRSREVLGSVIHKGAGSLEFFGTARGQSGDTYVDFQSRVDGTGFDDSLLLIEPETARKYLELHAQKAKAAQPDAHATAGGPTGAPVAGAAAGAGPVGQNEAPTHGSSSGMPPSAPAKNKRFRGCVDVDANLAKSALNKIAEDIVKLLTSDPNATVRLVVEIDGEFGKGAADHVRRAVSENAKVLNFRLSEWE